MVMLNYVMPPERFVIEVIVTAVDPNGDELELITLRSDGAAIDDKHSAVLIADDLAKSITARLVEYGNGVITSQYPVK